MSYEGYTQALCEKGHLTQWGCWDHPERVCRCGSPITQFNDVDETNGCEVRYVEGSLPTQWIPDPEGRCQCGRRELIPTNAGLMEQCNLGHWHEMEEATYKFGEVHKGWRRGDGR